MKNRKHMVSILAGVMAGVMLLTLILSLIPTRARAASSSEIRKQINALKEEREEIKEKIKEVKEEYKQNTNEIMDIIARKDVIDQEVKLLHDQVENMNKQIASYNTLIADKQDELDVAEGRYDRLNDDNRVRIRTMEEEGSLSYWEVLFRANSFSDLLDRLNMIEEIASSDNRRLAQLDEAANMVLTARDELQTEKEDLEAAKKELDDTQAQLEAKQQEALDIFQELLSKGDELIAMGEDFEAQEAEFLKQIAKKEEEYTAAKQAEWEAYMATYVPPTTAPKPATGGGSTGSGNSGGSTSSGGGSVGSSGGGGWLVPCNYTSITSPFGTRVSPTTGASTNHQGVDLDTGTGWKVVASRAGTAYAGYSSSAGNYVSIDHHDGFKSIYMHLSAISISSGTNVSAGQQIGLTGATGIATGDHLHFGISLNGVYVNPCNYVNLR